MEKYPWARINNKKRIRRDISASDVPPEIKASQFHSRLHNSDRRCWEEQSPQDLVGETGGYSVQVGRRAAGVPGIPSKGLSKDLVANRLTCFELHGWE